MIEAFPTGPDLALALTLFRDPILCAVIAGAVLGYLSVFVIVRRMVFVTAALSQASGLGVALGFLAALVLDVHGHDIENVMGLLGAVGASLAGAALLSVDATRLRLSRETLLAGVWLTGGAGAVLVGSRITQEAHDVSAILFGSAVLVLPTDLALVVLLGGIIAAVGAASHRALVFAGFDPDGARVQGLPVRWLDLLFLTLLTLMVSVSTRALGALPVFSFSVLPGMAALLAVGRLKWAFPLAVLIGAASGGLGYMVAFFLDLPVGAAQSAVALGAVLAAAPLRLLRSD